ncbi:RNA polymerase sigma factor [Psychroserpens sp. XS_ASV72]|uniref:RNA polymerase sigma factor n=1 Tax=Psychroserpens sp. XS_ASV72 TaxID=3241293 RepID=UPI003517C264
MTTNDQIIINQVINGDTNAFAVLVDRYKDLVFTLAMRMLKNREEAEEVAQDTFVKSFQKLDRFKGDSKFSTWLYRVAYNTCLDRIKKNKKHLNDVEINEFTAHQVRALDNILDSIEEKEKSEIIIACINNLPSEESFLLTLYYFDELSLDEISTIVGINSNAIKVKLFRTRKKLAKLLKLQLEPEIIEHYERERR